MNFIKRYYGQKRYREGGPGSGNWGHKGIPGHRGGSAPKGGGGGIYTTPLPNEQPASGAELLGGRGETRLVTYDDGSMGVWKPKFGSLSGNEVAASKLSNLLGLGVVPHTKYGVDDHGREGTIQRFIPGDTGAELQKFGGADALIEAVTSDTGLRIGVLDKITNQSDRNLGNFIQHSDGSVYAIDNEAVSDADYTPRSRFVTGNKGRRIPSSLLSDMENVQRSDFRRAMQDYGGGVDNAFDRFEEIRNTGQL